MTRTIRGLTAALLLAAILTATPWLLLTVGRLPGFLPAWTDLSRLLTSPDTGRFLLVLVWAAAWALWGWIALIILVEIAAVARRVKAPRLPASTGAQALVRALVIAAAAAFVTAPLATADTTPPTTGTTTAAPTQPVGTTAEATAERETAPVVEGESRTVIVREGDTLWDLAEEHLGDPQRWPEIFELNRGVPQPSGYALEDPDQIDIGWTLTLPPDTTTAVTTTAPKRAAAPETDQDTTTTTEPAAPAAVEEQDEAPAVNASAPAAAVTPTPEVSVTPSSNVVALPRAVDPASATADPVPVDEDQSEVEASVFGWQVAGLLGAGTFLGVGVAALLASRRREQHRIRRPGRVIVTPPAVVAPIEKTAHLATGLSAPVVARLDAILSRLDPDLDLTAVTVTRDGTITLHTTDPAAGPWDQDETGWILHHSVPVEDVGDLVPDRPCPFPLLVTIGADADDAVVLLNLEHVGHVTVTGDELMVEDFLRYLAAELAVNPWSEYVRTHCTGPVALVVGMAADRMDAGLDEIRAIARENLDRTSLADVNSSVGRAEQLGDEHWPTGALIGDTTPADLTVLVQDHPLRAGVAIVTPTASAGVLTVSEAGRVEGLGFSLTAVGLTEDEAVGCAVLLAAAETDDDAPAPPSDHLVDVTGNILPDHTTERDDLDGGVEPVLPFPDDEYIAATAATGDDLEVLAPRVEEAAAAELVERDWDLDSQVRAWFSDRCPYPRLALLGPATARINGTLTVKRRAFYIELLAYLALHPDGVTLDQLATAFGLKPQRTRAVMTHLRQWLGTNPRTNTPHIPDARSSEKAKARGVGLYLVEDLLLDVDLFRRLRARATAKGQDGIAELETALSLVTGRPFDQPRAHGWTWLSEGDRIDHHMVCAVGDVAHTMVTHHLHADDVEAAARAASIGLQADPDSEVARLDLAAVMIHQGHPGTARSIVAEALGDSVDLDLTPRGAEVLSLKNWLRIG